MVVGVASLVAEDAFGLVALYISGVPLYIYLLPDTQDGPYGGYNVRVKRMGSA